jgi:hypothetical protein
MGFSFFFIFFFHFFSFFNLNLIHSSPSMSYPFPPASALTRVSSSCSPPPSIARAAFKLLGPNAPTRLSSCAPAPPSSFRHQRPLLDVGGHRSEHRPLKGRHPSVLVSPKISLLRGCSPATSPRGHTPAGPTQGGWQIRKWHGRSWGERLFWAPLLLIALLTRFCNSSCGGAISLLQE